MRKRFALWKICGYAASKGVRRFRKRDHRSFRTSISDRDRGVTLVNSFDRMRNCLKVLAEKGWKMEFRAEFESPRGFRYAASSTLPQVAFFKALGDWANDVVPKIKKEIAAITHNPLSIKEKRYKPGSRAIYMREYKRKKRLGMDTSRRPGISHTKQWRQEYMRRYRNRLMNELIRSKEVMGVAA